MKNYQSPEMSIIILSIEDVITASGFNEGDTYANDNNVLSSFLFR